MNKLEIITQLVASFNQSKTPVYKDYDERVDLALKQYNRMVALNVIEEEEKEYQVSYNEVLDSLFFLEETYYDVDKENNDHEFNKIQVYIKERAK